MSTIRYAFATLAIAALCQCESAIGPVDSRHPSVEQQDALDVQWGLQPRRTKGSPRRIIPAGLDAAMGISSAAAPSAVAPQSGGAAPQSGGAAPAPTAPVVAPTAAAPAAPSAVSPSVLEGLR